MGDLAPITELDRLHSPATTPQALTWHGEELWMGSRDLRRIYRMEKGSWKVLEEIEAQGIPWAAVSAGDTIWFTLGEGEADDRYLHPFQPGRGFLTDKKIACPEFTGSYLSYDGNNLYLSQWYNFRILKLGAGGEILREISVGSEISGHVFADGMIYILCGTEQGEGDWRIARLNPAEEKPGVEELARVPFQCRSLAFDGSSFWTNHREADRIVRFKVPVSELPGRLPGQVDQERNGTMRKVTFGGASSLDSYFARKDDSVDWLMWAPEAGEVMRDYWRTIDTVVMGRRTYEVGLKMTKGKGNPYAGMKTYVFSRTLGDRKTPGIEVISTDPVAFVRKLKRQRGKDICVMGGGLLARALLEGGVIDKIGFNIQPILLGSGIPLFHEMKRQIDLELLDCKRFKNGCVMVTYRVLRSRRRRSKR